MDMTSESVITTRAGTVLPGGSGMGGGIVAGVFDQAESMRPTLYGERWAVVAGHPLVGEVASDILRRGGNAADAGVAAGFASNVVQVQMCNLGGIAPILVRRAGEEGVDAIAGIGTWGANADLDRMLAVYRGRMPLGGAPSIVPGAVSGWLTALSRNGTMTLPEVIAPAIELAEKGFLLDPRTASDLNVMSTGFGVWPTSAGIYQPHGSPLRTGQRLRQRALARTLRALSVAAASASDNGSSREESIEAAHRVFYTGEIAEAIVRFTTERGGTLQVSDLAGFRADVSPAPSTRFGGWQVYVTPTWSQGPIIAQALGILERRGIRDLVPDSPPYVHEIIEALKLAFSERERAFGDSRFTGIEASDLLTDEHLDGLAARVGTTALPNTPTIGHPGVELPSTTAIVVVDSDGGAFSSSPSDTIDGAPLIPELGIICSPRGVQSRLMPGHPNALRAGGRPCVTPAAVIALRGDESDGLWATACPGGDVIVQAIVQVMLQVDVAGKTLQAAVEAPRVFGSSYPGGFHPHPEGDSLVFVEAGMPDGVAAELMGRGHHVVDWPANEFDAGSVQTIVFSTTADGERILTTGADSRRSAYAYAR